MDRIPTEFFKNESGPFSSSLKEIESGILGTDPIRTLHAVRVFARNQDVMPEYLERKLLEAASAIEKRNLASLRGARDEFIERDMLVMQYLKRLLVDVASGPKEKATMLAALDAIDLKMEEEDI